eukprot:7701706-Alexandrium_andersonii.AAC.1
MPPTPDRAGGKASSGMAVRGSKARRASLLRTAKRAASKARRASTVEAATASSRSRTSRAKAKHNRPMRVRAHNSKEPKQAASRARPAGESRRVMRGTRPVPPVPFPSKARRA